MAVAWAAPGAAAGSVGLVATLAEGSVMEWTVAAVEDSEAEEEAAL